MALNALPMNPMNFTENQQGSCILEKLRQQKERGRFCDVTFYVDGKRYGAHRNVLASCSPYFDSVLNMHSTIREGLTITCVKSEIFCCLLNYMYTGSIVIDKNNVAELLKLSNHFLVTKLRNYCAEYLNRYLDITNCLSVKDMAEKYNMPSLLKAATVFIKVNVLKVVLQEEILYCSLKKIEAFLSHKAWALPADAVLQLVARWTLLDVGARERAFRALLTFVDWRALDGDCVAAHIDRDPLYAASDWALFLVLQALADCNLLPPKYRSAYLAYHKKYHAQLSLSDWMEKCSSNSDTSILVKSHIVLRQWPRKPVHWASRPGVRLAALKAALSARRRKLNAYNSTFRDVQGHYSCHLCSHVANSLCFLEQHVAVAHCKDVTYKCGVCGFMCQWNEEYLTHMKEHYQGPPYKCESCKFTCDEVNIFLAHRLKHSVDNFCQCDYCGYQCNNHSELTLHKLCHSNVHPYKYLF